MKCFFKDKVNNKPKKAKNLTKNKQNAEGQQDGAHRFHMLMNSELHKLLMDAAEKNKMSIHTMINKILSEMNVALDEFDLALMPDREYNDCRDLDIDEIYNINILNMRKLEYLHYRFRTRSIATIIRRILKIYLVEFKRSINKLLTKLQKFVDERVWAMSDFHLTHMWPESPPTRVLYQDKYNEIHYLRVEYK